MFKKLRATLVHLANPAGTSLIGAHGFGTPLEKNQLEKVPASLSATQQLDASCSLPRVHGSELPGAKLFVIMGRRLDVENTKGVRWIIFDGLLA